MGLWDWILDRWLKPNTTVAESAPHTAGSRQARSSAVATLERDDEIEGEAEKWWAPLGAKLTEPPPTMRPQLDAGARAMENLLVSHFDGHDLRMPPLLHVAETILPRLRDPKFSLSQAAESLAQDQVVAAAVLRMANSPLFRGLNKITALQPAVTRLGTNALRTLLMHESFRAATFFRKGSSTEYAKAVWQRSLASACVMHHLSTLTNTDRDEAFLTGLLIDIGNVIVLRVCFGDKATPGFEIDLDTFHYLCDECHQEFGELIANAWDLPPTLKTLISDHHTYPTPDDALYTQRLQIQVTDMINSLLGYWQPMQYDLMGSRAVAELGLKDNPRFITMLERLPEELDEMAEYL